ncbi:Arylesterase [hydrothermal vent metagenome]|uniref:Arylesterase n=1 Tax=hydrothermal vent metagenome TaxID=652676 RepID=A0A3B0UV93_9ZZZZ
MKNILCFGDSLTWGAIPNGGRHEYETRWPNVLQTGLGAEARVIVEGLNGRTTIFDDFSTAADLNGARILPTLLATHQPLDCVIIMLGCNDMKPSISGCAVSSARGMLRLVQIIKGFPYVDDADVPKILLVAPPVCVETDHEELGVVFAGAVEQSAKLAAKYIRVANEEKTAFFDAASVANASPIDGVHLDEKNTKAIGMALREKIKSLLQI